MEQKRAHNIDWDLVAKDMAGELSASEHEQLNHELSGDKDLLGQLNQLWGDTKYAQEIKSIDTDKAWTKVSSEIHQKQHKHISMQWKKIVSVAASLIFILAAYVLIKNLVPNNKLLQVLAQNEITQVELEDGTLVDLNIGSSLQYPESFNTETRNVHLNGEAFFDVARNEQKPFIIETQNLRIKVLGTSFNVKANALNGDENVSVTSGRVEVWHMGEHVVLEKGEAANFNLEAKQLIKSSVTDVNYNAWKTREIEFENVTLTEAIAVIQSVYHIKIETDNEIKPDSLMLKAQFSHDDLEHVLNVVCQTFNLTYTQQNDKYQIQSVR
nr:FecR domain-containing protein [uncultured Carboxylicivirga sp.]